MNIGIFTDSYFPQVNGVVYTIAEWKKRLQKHHNIYVYYPGAEGYSPGEREYPFRSYEFKFYKGYHVAFPTDITEKSRKLDVVHIHGLFTMAIAGYYASKKHKIPRILTYHTPADDYINYITRKEPLRSTLMKSYNFWEKKLLNSCDYVTAPSKTIRDRLLSKGVNDVTVLSNGVDLDFFHYMDPTGFKEKYNIKSEKVIGFCGRFGYEKHLEDIISFANDFDGEIIMAGKGPAEEHYKKLAAGRDNVKILGFLSREDLREFYSALDLFVFPSTAETQGLVALESMACGVPVVGANAMALKDTIGDGVTGYLYEQGDIAQLKEMIDKCYVNRDKLARNCASEVKKHSMDNTIKKLLEIYSQLTED
ncbi:MAG: glycosyl transferase family 1 [Candidatus Altiarchaeales archaeon ex4484_96]|nr:MAG: glycosyl transferase family 1 [Candidatus Altiarchaeales archaeon ex4484_96]